MIHVIATVEVVAGKRDEFVAVFQANVPHVLAEKGCVEYVPTLDVPTEFAAQAPPREQTVVIVEKWEDLDALRAHMVAPHMIAYRERVKDLVQHVSLQILQPA